MSGKPRMWWERLIPCRLFHSGKSFELVLEDIKLTGDSITQIWVLVELHNQNHPLVRTDRNDLLHYVREAFEILRDIIMFLSFTTTTEFPLHT